MTMMMTTSPEAGSEIELAGNEQLELQLGDVGAEPTSESNEPVDTPETPLTASEPISLPAALCDELRAFLTV